jgi:hypothetical protein
MKAAITLLFSTACSFAGGNLFRESFAGKLKENDQKAVTYFQRDKHTRHLKLVEFDATALKGRNFTVPLFDRAQENLEITDIFAVGGDSTWKGKPADAPPHIVDRFSITKTNNRYSGYFFVKGRMYEIHPTSKETMVMVERDLNFECGTGAQKKDGGR